MFESIISRISDLFTDFSWRRLSGTAATLLVVVGALAIYDRSTGHTYYERLKKKGELVRTMSSEVDLDSIEKGRLREVANAIVNELYTSTFRVTISESVDYLFLVRTLVANWLFFLVLLSAISDYKRKKVTSANAISGTVVVIVISMLTYYYLHSMFDIASSWWVALFWPVGLLVPFFVLGVLVRKKKA